jgi:predicted SAM-dependent methyltransferase
LKGFSTNNWNELRYDIDEGVNPDLIGSLTDMSSVNSSSVDAIYSSHNIEHVFPHEVSLVFKEFIRVLKPDGFLVLSCPDLQSVCNHVANGNLAGPLYISSAGPISAMDILFGHMKAIENGNVYMSHKCGFTWEIFRLLL